MFVYGTAILLAEKIRRPKVVVQIGIITAGRRKQKIFSKLEKYFNLVNVLKAARVLRQVMVMLR